MRKRPRIRADFGRFLYTVSSVNFRIFPFEGKDRKPFNPQKNICSFAGCVPFSLFVWYNKKGVL